jgi:hypothetical protein
MTLKLNPPFPYILKFSLPSEIIHLLNLRRFIETRLKALSVAFLFLVRGKNRNSIATVDHDHLQKQSRSSFRVSS